MMIAMTDMIIATAKIMSVAGYVRIMPKGFKTMYSVDLPRVPW